jgi:hypothetical protein
VTKTGLGRKLGPLKEALLPAYLFEIPQAVDQAVCAAYASRERSPPDGRVSLFSTDLALILREREIYRHAIMRARSVFDLEADSSKTYAGLERFWRGLAIEMKDALELAHI